MRLYATIKHVTAHLCYHSDAFVPHTNPNSHYASIYVHLTTSDSELYAAMSSLAVQLTQSLSEDGIRCERKSGPRRLLSTTKLMRQKARV